MNQVKNNKKKKKRRLFHLECEKLSDILFVCLFLYCMKNLTNISDNNYLIKINICKIIEIIKYYEKFFQLNTRYIKKILFNNII